ncbi:hemerythrin domain-containing protein [Chondromyces crocatus]|uniref:Hemerythrin-like domain-containing protein n=1 Tax=Chondromyces crocatus TaxID=52 RepID=A0A0K1EGS3_CHOCO|nr:hemerythrin domain-containing protein [Chondromyces crocatus]AKT39892.1 uncharacterized protein CMC5_040430 [Chondromyces crocatus]
MDALDLLEQQHLDIGGLIDRIAAEASPGRRTMLLTQLFRLVEAHVRIEETYLYPVCGDRMKGDRSQLHEAYEKHALMRFAADNLLRTRATDVRFEARLKLLKGLFEQHAIDEESWMFQKVKRDLTDEQLDVLGGHLERAYDLLLHLDTPAPVRAPMSRLRRTTRKGVAPERNRAAAERAAVSNRLARIRV